MPDPRQELHASGGDGNGGNRQRDLFHLFRLGIALTAVGDHGEPVSTGDRDGVLARHPPAPPGGVAMGWKKLHHHVTGSVSRHALQECADRDLAF